MATTNLQKKRDYRMLELVLANLKVRPFRTLISVIGVALGVVLIVLFTGLARGMTNDIAKRAANWKAEIIFTRPGGMEATSSNTTVNVEYANRLLEIDGVQATVPVIRYFSPDSSGTWGIKMLDGVDWQPFAEMNDINLVEGRAPQGADEIIIDQQQVKDNNLKVGDAYELFGGKQYKITGVFSPPSGARIKMSLPAMQEALQTDKCSYILVKIKDRRATSSAVPTFTFNSGYSAAAVVAIAQSMSSRLNARALTWALSLAEKTV